MEVIVDELKKKGVHVDIETFSEHIEYILGNYRDSYNEAVDRLKSEELILDVFHEMNVNTLGRAMAYLTLVYRTSHLSNEDTTRKAVRLAAPVLRNVGRGLHTEPLLMGCTKSIELMGFNVNNLYNK